VHIGAIVTVSNRFPLQIGCRQASTAGHTPKSATLSIARWDVLGKSVLERVVERLQVFGVEEVSVIAEPDLKPVSGTTDGASDFWTECENVLARYLSFDVETLLLMRVGPYIELDITEFLRFHRETASTMTQVYDQQGPLDLVAVDGETLRLGNGSFHNRLQSLIRQHQRYDFSGYSNRLKQAGDYRQLVRDALSGRVAIRPAGKEILANIWIGDGAEIHPSAQLQAPAYIGRNSRLRAGCFVSEASAIEQHCELDHGTVVSDSCVLAGTYVGAGLRVRGAVACQNVFFHLARNVEMQFRDPRLLGEAFKARGFLQRSGGLPRG
jgi:hypothetical protein